MSRAARAPLAGLTVLRALLVAVLLFGPGGRSSDASAQGQEGARPTVYVYLHTDTKSALLEKGLQQKLPALEITVFGRFRDFEEAMTTKRPDAVVALGALLASQNVPIALQGLRGENDWEPYVLLSPGAPLDGSLSGKVIGVVDLLGRNGTQDFVSKLLKTADVKLKRVTKMEDLLPLLQFSAADGVLVPSAAVKSVTERSRLPLRVRELPDARVTLPAVGILNPKNRALMVKQIMALDGDTNRILGVEKWRTR
jgi:hypothetical protein